MRIGSRLYLLLFLLIIVLPDTAVLASGFFRVTKVIDGDTIVLADGRRVRYIGINAPELANESGPAERFGPEARDFNRKLVDREKVRLEFDREKHDQYGRVLAYVFLPDDTFVNAELVKSGNAYCVFRRPNTKYDSLLLQLQREAMAKKAGMWEKYPNEEGPFLGNCHSRRFHKMTCPFGGNTSAKNRIIFKTSYDAYLSGYSPCKRCFNPPQ
ncbi:MAG: thermonuclease family protein [Deltaproteobacteria bacterium]|nr:thermonuclease family protein [Deltaproteobacteria bacterium]